MSYDTQLQFFWEFLAEKMFIRINFIMALVIPSMVTGYLDRFEKEEQIRSLEDATLTAFFPIHEYAERYGVCSQTLQSAYIIQV